MAVEESIPAGQSQGRNKWGKAKAVRGRQAGRQAVRVRCSSPFGRWKTIRFLNAVCQWELACATTLGPMIARNQAKFTSASDIRCWDTLSGIRAE